MKKATSKARPRPEWLDEYRFDAQPKPDDEPVFDYLRCVVTGCQNRPLNGTVAPREGELPICVDHAATVWNQIERNRNRRDIRLVLDVIAENATKRAAIQEAQIAENKRNFRNSIDGDIYFIRLNDLIKVGWSRELEQRVKSYGASAELLAHYPATRDDETQLHRQLRPSLARGREWYHNGDVIQMFIARTLEAYGPPTVKVIWTEPVKFGARRRR